VILDENVLAEGHDHFSVGVFRVSTDHRLLAYSTDTLGNERFTMRFRDLETGEDLPDEIPNTSLWTAEWAEAGRFLFYLTVDEANRPNRLFRHALGADPKEDALVYEETDEAYHLGVGKSRSRRFLFADSGSIRTTEIRYLAADDPEGEFRVFAPRRNGIEYDVEHHGDRFLIVTNEDAVNFRMMETPVATPGREHWTETIPHRPEVKLGGVDAFADHLVLTERSKGLLGIRVQDLASGEWRPVTFPEPVYGVWVAGNPEFDTKTLRFHYTSFLTPMSVFDYDMETRDRELRKETEVLGGYDRTAYESERIFAKAADGAEVPISIVRRKGAPRDGTAPMLLGGYGSYGMSMDPYFDSNRLSLLDRGVTVAIAHIRGGGEMGRPWYEAGKLMHKRNTFTDFVACAEHLIADGATSADRLAIRGGSAGGLLIGAVLNLRPDLCRCAVANVPFVDVVNTMFDASLPLTVIEWEEWGNPNDSEFYAEMMSYSPYDNVEAKDYPAILATTGLNDPRVAYWEPAKWVAKLRELKADGNEIILKTEMGSGHGGKSGRYDRLKEIAFDYSFVLTRLGVEPA